LGRVRRRIEEKQLDKPEWKPRRGIVSEARGIPFKKIQKVNIRKQRGELKSGRQNLGLKWSSTLTERENQSQSERTNEQQALCGEKESPEHLTFRQERKSG